ncbi:MAG: PhpK family radical SAM P-methyltransferase [Proteobacteria bacterium]|nr:PhpK family radical SAM P-methyltransferase [Pseudomonadota bacterium]
MKQDDDITKDCLLIGFHDTNFAEFVDMMRGMGENTGSFRDLNLAYADVGDQPLRCMDLVNHFMDEAGLSPDAPYENCDFIWPVVLYLGSFLHRRGYTFDHVSLFHREKDELAGRLEGKQYRCVVITTTVYVSPHPIIEIVEHLRSIGVTAPVIVGGPYISNQHKVMSEDELGLLFQFIGGDIYVVSAEGETTLAKVIERLRTGAPLDDVPNIAVRRDGSDEFVMHPLETERNELHDEPVNYRLFGAEAIGRFVSLRTAKSCPFNCNFCGFPQRAGKYVYTDLDFVERELDAIAELGSVSTLTFLDDTFNVPKGRFKSILRLMIDRGYGFRWNSFYRSDHGDAETIELMAESGCDGVFLGIESGCDRMLELMNKAARKKHYAAAIDKFHEVGITTYGSFIIGFPGETRDSVLETTEFIETHAPTFYRAQLFYLDPATPVWRDREKLGVVGGGFEWRHPTMNNDEASTLIEQMFLGIKNSTWAPQHGFEDWSIYYLMRHGYTRDDVVSFVRHFNELVGMKLAPPADPTARDRVMDGARRIAVQARRRYLAQALETRPVPLPRMAPARSRVLPILVRPS